MPSCWKFEAQQINTYSSFGAENTSPLRSETFSNMSLCPAFTELGPAGICQVRSWVCCKFCPLCPSFPDRGRCKVRSRSQWGIFEVPMQPMTLHWKQLWKGWDWHRGHSHSQHVDTEHGYKDEEKKVSSVFLLSPRLSQDWLENRS